MIAGKPPPECRDACALHLLPVGVRQHGSVAGSPVINVHAGSRLQALRTAGRVLELPAVVKRKARSVSGAGYWRQADAGELKQMKLRSFRQLLSACSMLCMSAGMFLKSGPACCKRLGECALSIRGSRVARVSVCAICTSSDKLRQLHLSEHGVHASASSLY